MHPLDATTALTSRGERVWEAVIDQRWWIERGPYGGYLGAILARAAIAAVSDPDRLLRSLTLHFIAPPAPGPVRVTAELARAGRSTTTVALRMEQDGLLLVLGLVNLGVARAGGPTWDTARMPAAPPPSDCPPLAPPPDLPPFVGQFEVRPVAHGPGVRNLAWIRPRPARALDVLSLVLMADTWMPAAMSHLGRPLVVPTYDLTVHVRRPLPPSEGFVLAEFRSLLAEGGAWDEDGELWSADGTLLAQSRQLAMVRELPA